jgi:hypothetical protein
MKILPIIMGYPGAQYCCDRGFERWEKQMPYPEWYKEEFKLDRYNYHDYFNPQGKTRWERAATKTWNWRNHDLRMIEFFMDYPHKEQFTHFLFLEPDVYMSDYVDMLWIHENIKPRNNAIHVPRMLTHYQIPHWKYWKDLEKLSENERIDFQPICTPPLSCILIPTQAMEDLCFIKQHSTIFEKDVFSELRLPMLLNYMGYIIHAESLFDGIRCFPKPLHTDKTPFFHPYRK